MPHISAVFFTPHTDVTHQVGFSPVTHATSCCPALRQPSNMCLTTVRSLECFSFAEGAFVNSIVESSGDAERDEIRGGGVHSTSVYL